MTAEAIRRGYTSSKQAGDGKWKQNCSRDTWRWFNSWGFRWNVKFSTYDYIAPSGEVITMTYISPFDLMAFLIEKYPSILVGGLQCPTERAQNLRTFWDGFKLQHADHEAFREHPNNLQNLIPIAWHGDEGRGKRRGNTVVVSCQAIIGLHTVLQKKKRRAECECEPPISIQNKFSRSNVDHRLGAESLSVLLDQRTNMKGHSFMQHFPKAPRLKKFNRDWFFQSEID